MLCASPAQAGRFLPHRAHLSLPEKIHYFERSVRHERQVVAWLTSRRAPRTLERVSELRWARRALAWHERLLSRYSAKLAPRYTDLSAWLCIHRGEGSWSANTGNGYYGGLQMDWSFMRSYGAALLAAKGTADHWTPAEQIGVARYARDHGRGYYPWPNTARACGLI